MSRSLLQSPLSFHNYAERFDLLLHLEECQMHVDIKRYNREQVTLYRDKTDKTLLVLNVSGNVCFKALPVLEIVRFFEVSLCISFVKAPWCIREQAISPEGRSPASYQE